MNFTLMINNFLRKIEKRIRLFYYFFHRKLVSPPNIESFLSDSLEITKNGHQVLKYCT